MDAVSDATPKEIESFLPNVDTTFAYLGSLKYKSEEEIKFDITTPLEEVLGKIEEDNEEVATKFITKKRIIIASFIIAGVLLTAGIIIFALFAFGGPSL